MYQGEMYQNERLTWFEEGNAEFFAGSTRLDSVVPRKSIIGGLSYDPAKRYTAAQTLNAKYGTWDFITIRLHCNHICIITVLKCSIKCMI